MEAKENKPKTKNDLFDGCTLSFHACSHFSWDHFLHRKREREHRKNKEKKIGEQEKDGKSLFF